MIDSVERATLKEIYEGGVRRTHTPDEFLAAFKAALSDATEYAGIRPGEREELLAQLVAVCMEELFGGDGRFDPADLRGFGVDKVSGWT
jgi:hypothetical protein